MQRERERETKRQDTETDRDRDAKTETQRHTKRHSHELKPMWEESEGAGPVVQNLVRGRLHKAQIHTLAIAPNNRFRAWQGPVNYLSTGLAQRVGRHRTRVGRYRTRVGSHAHVSTGLEDAATAVLHPEK
eukprot:1619026-Rhodomonas_salina.1